MTDGHNTVLILLVTSLFVIVFVFGNVFNSLKVCKSQTQMWWSTVLGYGSSDQLTIKSSLGEYETNFTLLCFFISALSNYLR